MGAMSCFDPSLQHPDIECGFVILTEAKSPEQKWNITAGCTAKRSTNTDKSMAAIFFIELIELVNLNCCNCKAKYYFL